MCGGIRGGIGRRLTENLNFGALCVNFDGLVHGNSDGSHCIGGGGGLGGDGSGISTGCLVTVCQQRLVKGESNRTNTTLYSFFY